MALSGRRYPKAKAVPDSRAPQFLRIPLLAQDAKCERSMKSEVATPASNTVVFVFSVLLGAYERAHVLGRMNQYVDVFGKAVDQPVVFGKRGPALSLESQLLIREAPQGMHDTFRAKADWQCIAFATGGASPQRLHRL